MATLSVEKFLELVQLSNLIEGDAVQRTWQAALEKATPEQAQSAEYAASQLIEAGLLTRWQCDSLLKGRHKGFFLGKYKLLGHLGTGGMSAVYLAEHIAMHRRVAIKVLPSSRIDDSSYLARFYLEARAAASLDHPNIMRVYDIDQQDQNHFLVMEYVEGRDLQHTVKDDGPLPYDLAANYVLQSASGLQHAHDRDLVHRDIKPANLLVDNRGTVKVLDMGLAKFGDEKMASLTIAHDENVLGTADYLAPEQALNSHTVDSRADIYSLGCTFFFLLTGHPPFPDGTLTQRLMMHQTKSPPSIYNDRPNAPPALVDLCVRMMAKSPNDRPAKAGDVVKELEAYLAVAATRGAAGASGGGDAGSGASPRRFGGSGDGSSIRPAKGSPGLEDTVHDRNRDTMKGPPRAVPTRPGESKGGPRGPLKVAKAIDDANPLAFIADERPLRSRADGPDSSKQSGGKPGGPKTGSGKQSGTSSNVLRAKELDPGIRPVVATTAVFPVAPPTAPLESDLLLNESSLGVESLRSGADLLEIAASAVAKAPPLDPLSRTNRKGQRPRGSQLPQWLWLVVIGGMFVSAIIMVVSLVAMLREEPAPPAPKAAAPANGQPAPKGQPAANVQPGAKGQPAPNAQAASKGQPAAKGQPPAKGDATPKNGGPAKVDAPAKAK